MSLPTSKILKSSKSIMAIADLKNNSPTTQQAQNVQIVVSPTYTDKKVVYPNAEKEHTGEALQEQQTAENPYSGLPNEQTIINRSIETAMKKTEEITETIEEKDNTIKALSLIIEIIQSNPLIVNKYVVAEMETLAELIRLITNSDKVEIDCDDIECSCSKTKYQVVKRIYINKGGEVYGITQCPVILRLFDNFKISLNLVV